MSIKIRTVCGNGIGSSLMAANIVKKLCESLNVNADVKSVDLAGAEGESADLYITAERLSKSLNSNLNVAVIRSYTNKKKIAEDVSDSILKINK